jgi:hypothetical protein
LTRCHNVFILVDMKRLALFFAMVAAAAAVSVSQPRNASAGWCWPSCGGYGLIGASTVAPNGCWYRTEVCSGWGYWYLNGVSKTCYPGCSSTGNTTGTILYGFENASRIRGNFMSMAGKRYIQPADVGMGGYLRAQVSWWSGSTSQVNIGVAG